MCNDMSLLPLVRILRIEVTDIPDGERLYSPLKLSHRVTLANFFLLRVCLNIVVVYD